ncbi:PAS-domain containing protein [Aliishimia ponticola]|nr:PAS-domain containing protein [Aliishimia ponticola]
MKLEDGGFSFLFVDGGLVDASDEAEAMLATSGEKSDWDGVTRLFKNRFNLPEGELMPPNRDGVEYFSARDAADNGVLEVRKSGNRIRIDLFDKDQSPGASGQKLYIMKEKLETLSHASDVTPIPVWQVAENGTVSWFNPAYEKLYRTVFDQDPQPGLPLFRLPEPKLEPGRTRRVPINPPNARSSVWFDVQRAETRVGDFYSAVDANAIVRAEAAQRNFVQTLAKTFAHLTIGLAIFDDNRQLVLFNPAVIDLTGLGADFLSSRPNLLSFFDELRIRRLMPEPKNYNSWRQQIADLVAAAADGRYSETWTLDSGRTYRVTGRPHPEGAIAFLIEDISAEVSLTRKFRAELELSQSVLEHLGSAVAVFSSNGVLTVSNEAFRDLWNMDPDNSFAEVTVIDCMRNWQDHSKASPVWGELRDFVLEYTEKSSWTAEVEKTDGTVIDLAVTPLATGATLVRFDIEDTATLSEPENSGQDLHRDT